MNWASYKPEEFEGETYGQKDAEFLHFAELPSRTQEKFVIAMGQGPGKNRPTSYLESLGWRIIEPDVHLPDYARYHHFVSNSKAEWSIAKNGYVKSRSGWLVILRRASRWSCKILGGAITCPRATELSASPPCTKPSMRLRQLRQTIRTIAQRQEHTPRRISTLPRFALNFLNELSLCQFGSRFGRTRLDVES
jgi:hypothetical protein